MTSIIPLRNYDKDNNNLLLIFNFLTEEKLCDVAASWLCARLKTGLSQGGKWSRKKNDIVQGQEKVRKVSLLKPQAAQTLFVIYIRDSIALRFKPFKRMYENGSKIALNSTCSKGFK